MDQLIEEESILEDLAKERKYANVQIVHCSCYSVIEIVSYMKVYEASFDPLGQKLAKCFHSSDSY